MSIKKYEDFINEEIDFNIIKTDYNPIIIKGLYDPKLQDTIYRFVTNRGNSYDLYFSLTEEFNNLLDDGSYLYSHTNGGIIPTIFFSLTSRGLNSLTYHLPANKSENLEVMGRIVYLILEYDKKNNYPVYSIGEVNNNKYQFYSIYKKYFNNFIITKGPSKNYYNKITQKFDPAYYLIK